MSSIKKFLHNNHVDGAWNLVIQMKVSWAILAVVRVARDHHPTLASPRVTGESREILGEGEVAAGIAYIIFLPEVND